MRKQLHGMKKWKTIVMICKNTSTCIKKILQQEKNRRTLAHMEP